MEQDLEQTLDKENQTATSPGFTPDGIIAQPMDYVARTDEEQNMVMENESNDDKASDENKRWAQKRTNDSMK